MCAIQTMNDSNLWCKPSWKDRHKMLYDVTGYNDATSTVSSYEYGRNMSYWCIHFEKVFHSLIYQVAKHFGLQDDVMWPAAHKVCCGFAVTVTCWTHSVSARSTDPRCTWQALHRDDEMQTLPDQCSEATVQCRCARVGSTIEHSSASHLINQSISQIKTHLSI